MANQNGDGNDFNMGDLFSMMFGFPMPDRGKGTQQDANANAGSGGSIPVDATVEDPAGSEGGSGAGNSGNGGGRRGGAGSGNLSADVNRAFERMADWSRRGLIILAVVVILVLAFCYWWFHPAINLHSTAVWWWLVLIALIVMVGLIVASIRKRHDAERKKLYKRMMIIPLAVIVVFALGKAAGFSFIPGNAQRYASILDITDGTFAEDIEEVDYSEIPVIDHDSAVLLGNRAMGSIPEYVSQFEISDLYSQINYHGKPVRVSPLNYADLFKWLTNRSEGIPAYVLVDMTTQEAQVVRLEQPIKYSESEPLARNIDRYVQLKFPTYMFDEKSFEIDEDGTPWWIFPVQKRTIGLFDGTDIQRVVLVNACTGECQDYAIEDCPQWVDRAYPSDLVIQQYNWSGLYSGGWFNSWIGQKNVVRTTPGTDGTLGYNYIAQNDDVYLYSGVSSVTADNSIIGFILVNQRTGDAEFFSVAGATEDSAMTSAEGQVQNLRYSATFPLLLNIEGQPTYFMALKDAAGLVKMFAMVNIEQYQNVAVGDTVAETQQNYLQLLAQQGVLDEATASTVEAATNGPQVSGTIATIAQAVVDGNSHFYVTLEDGAKQVTTDSSNGDSVESDAPAGALYDFALPDLLQIVTYQAGDEITFTYDESADTSASSDAADASATSDASQATDASASDGVDQSDTASATLVATSIIQE
jgi:hypothetical protein